MIVMAICLAGALVSLGLASVARELGRIADRLGGITVKWDPKARLVLAEESGLRAKIHDAVLEAMGRWKERCDTGDEDTPKGARYTARDATDRIVSAIVAAPPGLRREGE